MKPFMYALFPKLGFNQHTARKIIYGSVKYGGFQLAHLILEQGYLAIKYFLGHVQEVSVMGDQIIISLSKAQLVSGSSHPLLFEVESNGSCVSSTWLSNIRTFLKCCKANITVPEAWLPTRQRMNDLILIDIFESMKPSTGTLEQLNAVKLFLWALTLADLANRAGTHIEHWALSGTR
eukprot:1838924-Ditylum_brightwellii.AAC.1